MVTGELTVLSPRPGSVIITSLFFSSNELLLLYRSANNVLLSKVLFS